MDISNRFYINKEVTAVADARFKNDILLKLFNRFTYKASELKIKDGAPNTLVIGDIDAPEIPQGCSIHSPRK